MKSILSLGVSASALALFLAACGGGGGGSSSSTSTSGKTSSTSTTGVAAVGAPLAGATITIVDANGKKADNIVAKADGTYDFPAGMEGPVVLKATLGSSYTLYSAYPVAPGQSTLNVGQCPPAGASVPPCSNGLLTIPEADRVAQININALTDVMARNGLSSNLDAYFAGTKNPTYQNTEDMLKAVDGLSSQLGAIVNATGLMTQTEFANSDPFTASMKADKQSKLDVLMEAFKVTCVDSNGAASTGLACPKYKVDAKFPLPPGFNTAAADGQTFDPSTTGAPPSAVTDASTGFGSQAVKDNMTAFMNAIKNLDKSWLVKDCTDLGGGKFRCDVVQDIKNLSAVTTKYWNGTVWGDTNPAS